MKFLSRTAVAVFLAVASASPILFHATYAVSQQPMTPKVEASTTITANKAFELMNALAIVGGNHDVVVGQGASQRAVSMPYEISLDVRWSIADNMTALRPILETASKIVAAARAAAETRNGGPLLDGSKAKKDFDEEERKINDEPRPAPKLFKIKRDALNVAANKYQSGVLMSLDPIIEP